MESAQVPRETTCCKTKMYHSSPLIISYSNSKGWIFGISLLCENSTNQSINVPCVLDDKHFFVVRFDGTIIIVLVYYYKQPI